MDLDDEELEATNKIFLTKEELDEMGIKPFEIENKTADEMFEKLGYEKIDFKDVHEENFFYECKYINKETNEQFIFYTDNTFKKRWVNGSLELPAYITMQELRAVNKKCVELGVI